MRRSLRRASELGSAVVLFAAMVFLALSLISYHQTDPSLSTAAGDEVRNWMGLAGAYAAERALSRRLAQFDKDKRFGEPGLEGAVVVTDAQSGEVQALVGGRDLRYRGFNAAERKRRIDTALERVGLASRMRHYPAELSGGQQQRVAIARALAGEPRLLLADEPTGNLDTAMARGVMELLEEINAQGTTIVMVTHDPELAQRAQRNVHIIDGQVSDLDHNVSLMRPRAAATPAAAQA